MVCGLVDARGLDVVELLVGHVLCRVRGCGRAPQRLDALELELPLQLLVGLPVLGENDARVDLSDC